MLLSSRTDSHILGYEIHFLVNQQVIDSSYSGYKIQTILTNTLVSFSGEYIKAFNNKQVFGSYEDVTAIAKGM